MAKQAAKLGATDADPANIFGVSDATTDNWKAQHFEFLGSLGALRNLQPLGQKTTSGKARAMAKKIVPKYEPEVARAKIGRPSAYHKEYAEQALHLCRLGATDHDLALAFHASVSMIKRWAATHAEFRAALKVGKEAADQRVERSLYQRAVGYHYDAVKIFMPAGAKAPIYAPYVEHVPPDTTAGIFWLKNRDPAHWRDAWQLEHVTGKYVISDKPLTEAEWIKQTGATVIDGEATDAPPTPAIEDKSDDSC